MTTPEVNYEKFIDRSDKNDVQYSVKLAPYLREINSKYVELGAFRQRLVELGRNPKLNPTMSVTELFELPTERAYARKNMAFAKELYKIYKEYNSRSKINEPTEENPKIDDLLGRLISLYIVYPLDIRSWNPKKITDTNKLFDEYNLRKQNDKLSGAIQSFVKPSSIDSSKPSSSDSPKPSSSESSTPPAPKMTLAPNDPSKSIIKKDTPAKEKKKVQIIAAESPPESKKPAKPAKSAQSVKPVEPVRPLEPAKPVEPATLTSSSKTVIDLTSPELVSLRRKGVKTIKRDLTFRSKLPEPPKKTESAKEASKTTIMTEPPKRSPLAEKIAKVTPEKIEQLKKEKAIVQSEVKLTPEQVQKILSPTTPKKETQIIDAYQKNEFIDRWFNENLKGKYPKLIQNNIESGVDLQNAINLMKTNFTLGGDVKNEIIEFAKQVNKSGNKYGNWTLATIQYFFNESTFDQNFVLANTPTFFKNIGEIGMSRTRAGSNPQSRPAPPTFSTKDEVATPVDKPGPSKKPTLKSSPPPKSTQDEPPMMTPEPTKQTPRPLLKVKRKIELTPEEPEPTTSPIVEAKSSPEPMTKARKKVRKLLIAAGIQPKPIVEAKSSLESAAQPIVKAESSVDPMAEFFKQRQLERQNEVSRIDIRQMHKELKEQLKYETPYKKPQINIKQFINSFLQSPNPRFDDMIEYLAIEETSLSQKNKSIFIESEIIPMGEANYFGRVRKKIYDILRPNLISIGRTPLLDKLSLDGKKTVADAMQLYNNDLIRDRLVNYYTLIDGQHELAEKANRKVNLILSIALKEKYNKYKEPYIRDENLSAKVNELSSRTNYELFNKLYEYSNKYNRRAVYPWTPFAPRGEGLTSVMQDVDVKFVNSKAILTNKRGNLERMGIDIALWFNRDDILQEIQSIIKREGVKAEIRLDDIFDEIKTDNQKYKETFVRNFEKYDQRIREDMQKFGDTRDLQKSRYSQSYSEQINSQSSSILQKLDSIDGRNKIISADPEAKRAQKEKLVQFITSLDDTDDINLDQSMSEEDQQMLIGKIQAYAVPPKVLDELEEEFVVFPNEDEATDQPAVTVVEDESELMTEELLGIQQGMVESAPPTRPGTMVRMDENEQENKQFLCKIWLDYRKTKYILITA